MLHDFLKTNRAELIQRCRTKVAKRRSPLATPGEIEHGVPIFLDQLADMLEHPGRGRATPAPPAASVAGKAEAQIKNDATLHGGELLRRDYTITQVVHDYGDLCQAITELADEQGAPITVQEFGILNIRLDNAIAGAVAEFTRKREQDANVQTALALNERLGVLAHEMRNLLNTSILALAAIRAGSVGFGGATAAALDRSLIGMSALIDRTLAGVRLEGGRPPPLERIEMGPFVADLQVAAALEAAQKGCSLTVLAVEPDLFVQADRHILGSAVANLLQNAFKFTRPDSHVQLSVHAANRRVLMEVKDECGGLPAGVEELIFRPFEQRNANRSGVRAGPVPQPRGRRGIRRQALGAEHARAGLHLHHRPAARRLTARGLRSARACRPCASSRSPGCRRRPETCATGRSRKGTSAGPPQRRRGR